MWNRLWPIAATKPKPSACVANSAKPSDPRLRQALARVRLALCFGLLCFIGLGFGLLQRHATTTPQQNTPTQSPSATPTTATLTATVARTALGITVEPAAYTRGEFATRVRELEALGFRWIRVQVDWAQSEPQPGRWDWRILDAFLRAVAQTELTPVFVLVGSPAWAAANVSGTDPPQPASPQLTPPDDPRAFARFAARVAQRVQDALPSTAHPGTVRPAYQIWHEPNLAANWGNRHVDAVGYAQLVRLAAQAVRAQDPRASIVSGALAPTNDRGLLAQDEIYFLQRFLAAGGGSHASGGVDAIAVQPFGFAAPPLPTVRDTHAPAPQTLSFARVLSIRRALEDAGCAHLPIWATGFGWNRLPNATWRTVSPALQIEFSAQAVALAHAWPWLAALGWPIDQTGDQTGVRPPTQPAAPSPSAEARAGFALTPALAQALTAPPPEIQIAPAASPVLPLPLGAGWVGAGWAWTGLIFTLLLALQRGHAAYRLAGMHLPVHLPGRAGFVVRWLLWPGVTLVYFLATWPPLILLCWLLIGRLVWRAPRVGLYGAALLLPFYFYHKEVQWVDLSFTVAPSQLLAFALTPPLLRRMWRVWRMYRPELAWNWGWSLALTWLPLSLLSGGLAGPTRVGDAVGAGGAHLRHVPAFLHAFLDLALVPLILWGGVWLLARRRSPRTRLLWALAAGGTLAAAIGLLQWWNGVGVAADGTLRLAGPYFSPNHMALYTVRTLLLLLGLLLGLLPAVQRPGLRARVTGAVAVTVAVTVAVAVTAVALLLTASRGALLLGLPAGLLVLLAYGWAVYRRKTANNGVQQSTRAERAAKLAAVSGLALILALFAYALGPGYARLMNTATVVERVEIWRAALTLWQAHLWTGVGPGGFFWNFPAHIPIPAHLGQGIDPNLRHPHNLWLELLTTWGLAGAAWFGALAYVTLRQIGAARANLAAPRRANWPVAALMAGLAAGIAHGQVDAFLLLPDLAAWNALALALLLCPPHGSVESTGR